MRAFMVLLLVAGMAHAQPTEPVEPPPPAPASPPPEPAAAVAPPAATTPPIATTPPPPAPAPERYRPRRWHLGIEALTDFPLQIGGQIWLELPGRIRLSTSFGEMPSVYLDAINAIAVSAGAYSQTTADLLKEALNHAFTWRLHIGWRPFKNRGAYFEGGFGIMSVNGGLALAEVIRTATGFPIPNEAGIGLGYEIDTVVETVGAEVGWMWFPWRDLSLRVSLGFAATVGAQVHLKPNFLARAQGPFTRFAEAYIEELIERYLFIPTVGFAVGWRLF